MTDFTEAEDEAMMESAWFWESEELRDEECWLLGYLMEYCRASVVCEDWWLSD
jgi:hypothetical protein